MNKDHELYLFSIESDHDFSESSEAKPGVSVSLAERALALTNAAEMYGHYNRSVGLQKAAQTHRHREKLQRRYDDIDSIVERATVNSHFTQNQERQLLQPLLKEKALQEAGFDPADIDLIAKSVLYEVRQSFGTGVDSKTRHKNLRSVSRRS